MQQYVSLKSIFKISILSLVLFAAGCGSSATDEELTQMCSNLVKVRGEVSVPDEAKLLADIEADFQKKEAEMLAWKKRDMDSWDDELKEKIAALTDKDDKTDSDTQTPAQLKAEYAKKKEIGARQFDDDLAKLPILKKEALANARQNVADKQMKVNDCIKTCIDDAKKEGVSQKLAQCRIAAKDKDTYWNKCR
jgi:hypothetical protein